MCVKSSFCLAADCLRIVVGRLRRPSKKPARSPTKRPTVADAQIALATTRLLLAPRSFLFSFFFLETWGGEEQKGCEQKGMSEASTGMVVNYIYRQYVAVASLQLSSLPAFQPSALLLTSSL